MVQPDLGDVHGAMSLGGAGRGRILGSLVDDGGFEPPTSALRTQRSPN